MEGNAEQKLKIAIFIDWIMLSNKVDEKTFYKIGVYMSTENFGIRFVGYYCRLKSIIYIIKPVLIKWLNLNIQTFYWFGSKSW